VDRIATPSNANTSGVIQHSKGIPKYLSGIPQQADDHGSAFFWFDSHET